MSMETNVTITGPLVAEVVEEAVGVTATQLVKAVLAVAQMLAECQLQGNNKEIICL
jgi:hypothetical protein